MLVVEHHDDLFSWKKYNNYTFVYDTHTIYRHVILYNEFITYAHNALTLLAADCAVSRLE
jgi:hypothetical protein